MKGRVCCHRQPIALRRLLLLSIFLLLVSILFSSPLYASSPNHQLVRLYFKDKSQIQKWVDDGLDIWQVDGNTALVALPKDQVSAFEAEGIEPDFVAELAMVSFPACYRTYDDLVSFMNDRAERYPSLLQWHDQGDTWNKQNGFDGADLNVAQLTNSESSSPKPKLLIIAEQHAREIITAEVAMDFIDDLLQNYGEDPTITWLLDNREVWVMPMANPDGHALAVQEVNWRKNANRAEKCPYGAPPNSYGVDLNRNFGYRWGENSGSSADPCNLTYRGSAPFSEPETRAMRDLILNNNFRLIISLHSYGDSILYPWAHTREPAPDTETLRTLATRMAGPSGYTAMQGTELGYTASGDMVDWIYGELGIPSFTFEIGSMEDGFFWPPCDKKNQLYQEIRPALIYAAMATNQPYQMAGGPEAHEIAVEVTQSQVNLRAWVSDQWTGQDHIQSAELFVETLGELGTGIPLSPDDGSCNYSTEWFSTALGEDVLAEYAGRRIPVLVLAEDVTGKHGIPALAWLDLRDHPVPQSHKIKLWLDGFDEPAFEIKDGHIYQGPAEIGNIILTVRDGKVYQGADTTGELLYTLTDTQVRYGENGPVAYSEDAPRIYEGRSQAGTLLYRVDYDRLLAARSADGTVLLTANVNLAADGLRAARLLLPILMDRRY